MKIRIFCLIFFLVALAVNAQYQRQGLDNFDPRLALEKLSEDLDLTGEQIEMIEPVLNETKTKLNELKNIEYDNRIDMMFAHRDVMEELAEKIEEFLTEEQIEKFREQREERRRNFREGRGRYRR